MYGNCRYYSSEISGHSRTLELLSAFPSSVSQARRSLTSVSFLVKEGIIHLEKSFTATSVCISVSSEQDSPDGCLQPILVLKVSKLDVEFRDCLVPCLHFTDEGTEILRTWKACLSHGSLKMPGPRAKYPDPQFDIVPTRTIGRKK